ncbi:unnamed protein product [Rangifer tarandus platyrhynchus]|uniref:Uncharacterized protein n=2 Tax=Rangifer tarandus platyrhynchus TaxID=3082113 RepID=A0ABN8ZIW1_RANTA|nr:unnamed protein product [Rangifer tarandus platyrhynchus]
MLLGLSSTRGLDQRCPWVGMNFVPRSGVAEARLPLTPDLVGQAGSPELTLAALLQSGYKSWRRRRLSDPPGDLAQRGLPVTGPGGVKGRGRARALDRGLRSGSWALLLHGMWSLPRPSMEPVFPELTG